MKTNDLILRCGAPFALAMCLATAAFAQDTPAVPAAPVTETQRLKDEVERLKAEQEAFEAKFGKLADGLAPKGDIATNSLSIEGEILAYSTVDTIATQIAKSVRAANPGPTIALFSEPELKLLTEWRAVGAQVRILEDERNTVTESTIPGSCKPAPLVVPEGVPPAAIANVLVQAVSLFRVDRTITGTKVELNDFAVTAQVANQLMTLGLKVVYLPSVYDLRSSDAFTDIEIYRRLKILRDGTNGAVPRNGLNDEIKRTEEAREKLSACAKPFTPELTKWLAGSAVFLERRKQLLTAVNGMLDEITKPDATGVSRIQAYQRASQISALTKDAWLLQLEPIAAAGNVLVTKNLFYSKLRFGGGSVISYMLFHPGGELAKAGTAAAYKGALKMSEVPSLVGTP